MTTTQYPDGPRPVDKVPNPWEPYMDGRIWEFTDEQYREIGYPMAPMRDTVSGEHFGGRFMQWYVGGKHYVRFFEGPADPDVLAGWKAPK